MLLSENLSSNFLNKSKTNGIDECDAINTPYDIIEHDVTTLARTNNLPPPDSLDALQLGNDR